MKTTPLSAVDFEGDGEASAITRASAWIILNSAVVDVKNIVGTLEFVTVFYQQTVTNPPPESRSIPIVQSVRPIGPGSVDLNFDTLVRS